MTATMTAPPIEQVAPHVRTRVESGGLGPSKLALLGAGAVLLGASLILGLSGDEAHKARFAFSYLTAYMAVLGICLGGLFFVMLHHVTRAGWSVGLRRLVENLAGALPVMLLLYIPIYLGFDHLYPWVHAELDPAKAGFDKVVAGKSGWLNKPFFLARVVGYFAIWIGLATWFRRTSLRQDETGDPALSLRMSRVAAPGILLFALSITFAAFDGIMSLEPHWFSTIFGVCYFAGGYMAFFAFTILLTQWLGSKGYLRDVITVEHYHDLGKLMFAFVVFWTYVNFSQYMLIGYANLPEETAWFKHRREDGWAAVGTLIVFGHFFVPFAFLMSRHIKRNGVTLAIGAAFLLVIHWLDMQYLILPTAHHEGAEHGAAIARAAADEGDPLFGHFAQDLGRWLQGLTLLDVLCYVGMLSLVAGATVAGVCRHNLLPTRDPRLAESLRFENH